MVHILIALKLSQNCIFQRIDNWLNTEKFLITYIKTLSGKVCDIFLFILQIKQNQAASKLVPNQTFSCKIKNKKC